MPKGVYTRTEAHIEAMKEGMKHRVMPESWHRSHSKGHRFNTGRTHFKATGLTFDGTRTEYNRLHAWARRELGKPGTCEFCGKDSLSRPSNTLGQQEPSVQAGTLRLGTSMR